MPATINLYETFSEALHTIQELEAAQIEPDEISLIIVNGKPKFDEIDEKTDAAKPVKGKKKAKPTKAAAPKPVEKKPIDTDLKARFFSMMNLHEIGGLGTIVGAGWLVKDAIVRTRPEDVGFMATAASGLIESMVQEGLSPEHAETYVEGLKRGATLIGVKTAPVFVRDAERVMREDHRPLDPHMRGHHYWTKVNEAKEDRNAASNRMISMLISTVR